MSRIVNPVTVRPNELTTGDVAITTVTLHIVEYGDGLAYRMYQCAHPMQVYDGIPQGSRLGEGEEAVMRELFPVVGWAGIVRDCL